MCIVMIATVNLQNDALTAVHCSKICRCDSPIVVLPVTEEIKATLLVDNRPRAHLSHTMRILPYATNIAGSVAALALLFVPISAVEYTGSQCTGVVDFQLKAGTPETFLDAIVAEYVAGVPGWAKQECVDAVRTNVCGQIFAKYAEVATTNTTYCLNQCMDIAAACEATAGLDPDLAALEPAQQCQGLTDDACVAVGELDESLFAEGECPSPLVVAERQRFKHYEGKIVNVKGTACVVGCPIHKMFYGEEYLEYLDRLYVAWASAGAIGGTLILANIKPTGRRLYAW